MRSESSVTTYTFKDDKVEKDSRHESWCACSPITHNCQVASRLNKILQDQRSDEFFLVRCGLCIIHWHPAKLQWPQSLIGPLIISVRRSISYRDRYCRRCPLCHWQNRGWKARLVKLSAMVLTNSPNSETMRDKREGMSRNTFNTLVNGNTDLTERE